MQWWQGRGVGKRVDTGLPVYVVSTYTAAAVAAVQEKRCDSRRVCST